MTCDHGTCIQPNICACEIGWEGVRCEKCLVLPGCIHGHCVDRPFQCVCHDEKRWSGEHCDKPVCKQGCLHGSCTSPEQCL